MTTILATTPRGRLSILFEPRDCWVGAYVGYHAIYVCLLPFLVIRWLRSVSR